MTLVPSRRIRDNLHGTIDMTTLEDAVMAHPFFQRLRRVRALAFLHFVFPGATHSRFEHSLGVLHLAGQAWERLTLNQRRMTGHLARHPFDETPADAPHGMLGPAAAIGEEIFSSDYVLQTLRVAALAHDLGHPPFSHLGEPFLPSWKSMMVATAGKVPDYIREYLERASDEIASSGGDPALERVSHEVYSILMIDRVLRDVSREHRHLGLEVDPRDVCAVIDTSIDPASTSPLARYGTHRLCHELVSGEVDVDRMDYLLRDSRECGVVYGMFDAGRILDSLAIYYDPAEKGVHVAIRFSGLAAFEDFLRARHSMYFQVYFHKSGGACEAMLNHLGGMLDGWRLPTDLGEYASLDDFSIANRMLDAARAGIGSRDGRDAFREILENLLYERRFWKRAYEHVERADRGEGTTGRDAVVKALADKGTRYEVLSSSKSLTRMLQRDPGEASRNTLRLIKKDAAQRPRVVPIEDYSQLVQDNVRLNIERVYAESLEG